MTDFNYGFCNDYTIAPKYKIDPHKINDDIIGVEISFVLDVYLISIFKRGACKKLLESQIQNDPKHVQTCMLADSLRNFINSRGFIEMRKDWLNTPVGGVQLELSQHPTIYNCLFDDKGL